MTVRARKAVIVARLVVCVCLVLFFSVRRVADLAIRMVGGPHGVT